MVERQDIDALLISALYGELTPAEETRLATHLESHPADRTALDDLTRAREAVHQSRILTFQYEPPQSVSALLMQEASRRAPKKAPEGGEGWFARFVRSFVQHPAIAAAAMIVVVVGAASIVSRTSDNQFADTPAVETSKSAPTVATETPDRGAPSAAAPAQPPTDPAAGVDQFRVALADGENERADVNGIGNADKAKAKEGAKQQQALPESDPNVAFYESGAVATKPRVAKPSPDTGVELRRRDAMPKDFDEAKPAEARLAKKAEGGDGLSDDVIRGNRETGYVADGRATNNTRAGAGGGATAPGAVAAPTVAPPSPARNTSPPPPPPSKTAPRQEIATDSATPRDTQKKSTNDPNLAWARNQHAALVTAVRANNCGRAANIALSISNRTPAYYAQNVETDRSVKVCIAYINREREKDAEMRASRAKRSRLENAEPSAPKRAADEPSRATPTDSK